MGIALQPREQAELLGTHGTAVLATASASGAPIPLPVWYVVLHDRIYIRTPRSAKRLLHIANDSRVGFLVHAGDAWTQLRGLLVRGDAVEIIDPAEVGRVEAAMTEAFADLLPPPLPDAVAGHYAATAILRIDDPTSTSWDNRKIRL